MFALILIVCFLLLVFLAWCLLLQPRRNQPGWEKIAGFRYAHRGLHNTVEGVPENSLAAFRRAADAGFGAELDVHLMADGSLAVVHDSNLHRVCGKDLVVESMKKEDLLNYPLEGTGETVPLLEDVLKLFQEKTPLVIELKVAGGNAVPLTDRVMTLLKDWNGVYCIESFHPAVLLHLKKHYPAVIRGQLSENFLRGNDGAGYSWLTRAVLTWLLTTAFTRPDFIAYNHVSRSCPSLRLMRRLFRVHEVGWTIRDRGAMERLEADGVTVIFEKFVP